MPKRTIKISILNAVKQQLETAIRLFFTDADPVSMHALTGASHVVLTNFLQQNGSKSHPADFALKSNYTRNLEKRIRMAKKSLNSAAKNPASTITLNLLTNELFLFDACEKYMLLTSEQVPYFIIFRGWFVYKHPGLFTLPRGKRAMINNLMKTYHDDKAEYFSTMLSAARRQA